MNENNSSQIISKIQSCHNKFNLNNFIKSTTDFHMKTVERANPMHFTPQSNKSHYNKNKRKLKTNRKTWYDNEKPIEKHGTITKNQ